MVYVKSPGGIVATAARVARWRPQIEAAADDAGVDPDLIEGMVLLESAGRPDARASDDLEGAVGLTQILAQTATGLLGMQVDVRASERLTRKLERARGPREARGIRAARARVDERFDPEKSLAATGRYLKTAMDEFGREDLAVVSYHMGIGNLQQVLGAYGDDEASYTQLFFDASPNRHPRAYRLLAGLGDDSKTYLWRVLASREVMRLYREDRVKLARLAELQAGVGLGRARAPSARPHQELREHEEDIEASATVPDGELRPRGGRRAAPGGLRAAAYIGHGVRNVSGTKAPLTVTRTARPDGDIHATGFAFDIRRTLRSGAPGGGVPVHARPPPGAEPDRLDARRRHDPHHRIGRGSPHPRRDRPLVDRPQLLPGLPVVPRDHDRVRGLLRVLLDLAQRAPEEVLVGDHEGEVVLVERPPHEDRVAGHQHLAVLGLEDDGHVPGVWPGVKTIRTLPSPNTSKRAGEAGERVGVVRVEVEQAVVEAVVELPLDVAVARPAVGRRLPLGGRDQEGRVREVRRSRSRGRGGGGS